MPFIGQQPLTGAYSKLDSITTSATATYNLQLDSAAYSPASANHLLVSLNGVMQAPVDSFTVSGSTITFASALTSSDNIDFIMALGDVLNIGTPSDGTVTAAKIGSSAVTAAKIGSSAVTASKIGTGAVSQTKLASNVAGTGPVFSVYSSASQTGISNSTWTKMTFDTEEFDTNSCFASSAFTPNVAGYYSLNANVLSDTLMTGRILLNIYKNGASYKQINGIYASSARVSPSGSVLVYANGTTDYFEVWGYSDAGAWITNGGSGANWFTGALVRAA